MKTTFEKLNPPISRANWKVWKPAPAGRMKQSNGFRETTSSRRTRSRRRFRSRRSNSRSPATRTSMRCTWPPIRIPCCRASRSTGGRAGRRSPTPNGSTGAVTTNKRAVVTRNKPVRMRVKLECSTSVDLKGTLTAAPTLDGSTKYPQTCLDRVHLSQWRSITHSRHRARIHNARRSRTLSTEGDVGGDRRRRQICEKYDYSLLSMPRMVVRSNPITTRRPPPTRVCSPPSPTARSLGPANASISSLNCSVRRDECRRRPRRI